VIKIFKEERIFSQYKRSSSSMNELGEIYFKTMGVENYNNIDKFNLRDNTLEKMKVIKSSERG
jgi:hypothetical protein